MEIILTMQEKQLFEEILTIFHGMWKEPFSILVAGGWVRDKILGLSSNDIDLVVDGIGVNQVYHLIKEYIQSAKKYYQKIEGYRLWSKNPTKRKFSEILLIKLDGVSIEVTNPRTRDSSEASGSLAKDAHARDFTMNSLFFALKENVILDYTSRGMEDLRNKIIRTPAEPYVIMLEDPIRILRGIRFLSRFDNFVLDEDFRRFLLEDQRAKSLLLEVSRERIQSEIQKIILELWTPQKTQFALDLVKQMCRYAKDMAAEDEMEDGNLFTKFQMREEWKMDAKTVDSIHFYLLSWSQMSMFVQMYHDNPTLSITDNVKIGLFFRKIGPKWKHVQHLAKIVSQIQNPALTDHTFENFNHYLHKINYLGACPVWELKPFLEGAELAKLFPIAGVQIRKLLEEQIEWQISHPDKDKTACKEWLLNTYHSLLN